MQLNKRVCKVCMNEHLRIYSGKMGKDSSWRDEHGLLWNGKTCGGCNRDRVRVAVAKSRNKKAASGSDGAN